MKRHLGHLAMCIPMLIVVGIVLVSGAGAAVLLPVVLCMTMMGAMMAMVIGRGGRDDDRGSDHSGSRSSDAHRR